MLHPQDEQNLQRLLGTNDLPAKVLAEAEVRTQMYHRCGASGQLGPLALVEMLRYLGLQSPSLQAKPQEIDWRQFPQNGTQRVEAYFFGAWMPGVFLGFVEHGTLAVRLDGDRMVRECRRDMVRLASGAAENPDDDGPDARINLIEEETPVSPQETYDESPVDLEEPEQIEPEYVDPATVLKPVFAADPGDWSAAPIGCAVWVEEEGDVQEGVLMAVQDGALSVKVDDRVLTVSPDKVTCAGD